MTNRRSDEIRRSGMPIDRMASYQGEAVLKSYRHGECYFDVSTGLHWVIEKETPRDFLARLFRPNSDDITVIERKEGIIRSYRHGDDQSYPIVLGASSPEFRLLESKLRFPQLLTRPYLWKRLA